MGWLKEAKEIVEIMEGKGKLFKEENAKNNSMVICPNNLKGLQNQWKVFLMGAIQGAEPWQYDVPDIKGVTWLNPRRPKYPVPNFNYNEQVNWETEALRMSNVILAWIPEPSEDIEGRSYAQTTRYELGENIARVKTVILGTYEDFPGRKYLEYKKTQYPNVRGIFNSLEECVEELKRYLKEREKNGVETWFTSDTHFSSDRALELSKRPFSDVKEMDWTMIERWNNVVKPNDIVYHLGDFGDNWVLDYLTGNIKFVIGNYERDGKSEIDENKVEILPELSHIEIDGNKFLLNHEPIPCKENKTDDEFCLFGHIHGRQKIKDFGMDVGVDCNNFTPVSLNDVLFYKNAVEKGYYDEEVFC
jgi:calcineurin-like phosphoesterase family protein